MQEVNQESSGEAGREVDPQINREVHRQTYPEKDIFRGYEVRTWNFTPRLYKIIVVSAIVNIVSLFVFAQSNVLTTKGCDSPFVRTVCQVIDTVYVGSSIFGTDSEYAEFDYVKDELGEDSEITYVDVTGQAPPVAYPAGYFAIANPENFITDENGQPIHVSQLTNPIDPTAINPMAPDLTRVTPNYPTPNNNPVTGPDPINPYQLGNPTVNDPTRAKNGRAKKGKNPPDSSPQVLPNLGDGTVAGNDQEPEKEPLNSDPVEEIIINKKPGKKLVKTVTEKLAYVPGDPNSDVVLKPFKVVLKGTLTKTMFEDENGKREVVDFDENSNWIKKEESGDPAMIEIAREAVEAVGDSGFLAHLYNIGLKDIKITLVQAGDKIVVNVVSEQQSAERAKSLASGLNGLLAVANKTVKNDGRNERVLLDNAMKTPPTASGKRIIMNFEIPVDVAQKLIKKNLEETDEETKPNSAAKTLNSNSGSGK